ncbi:hypothetical protein [Ideonella sp.]|uniref:hypothetical protein n=1 Tax=Ideonella sp. TaxID=1929293 RepID=UPI0035B012D8
MLSFAYLRTKRVAVRLRELRLGEAIAICKLPADRLELTVSEFLRHVADGAERPTDRHITDPRLWTAAERTRVVCHYLSHTSDSGMDFEVGDGARLSHYVELAQDLPSEVVKLGRVGGSDVSMWPLLGAHAEVLERLCKTRGDWMIGLMACQVGSDPLPDLTTMSELAALQAVSDRLDAVRAMPESAFEELVAAYAHGQTALQHFFVLGHDNLGLVCLPRDHPDGAEEKWKEGGGLRHPARFPALSCVSATTRTLFG